MMKGNDDKITIIIYDLFTSAITATLNTFLLSINYFKKCLEIREHTMAFLTSNEIKHYILKLVLLKKTYLRYEVKLLKTNM